MTATLKHSSVVVERKPGKELWVACLKLYAGVKVVTLSRICLSQFFNLNLKKILVVVVVGFVSVNHS